jgi:GNAT superfamily N-acetyltransferase
MIEISPLRPDDRSQWEALARGYKAFYETEHSDERYEETWLELLADERIHGLAARYLHDLFTAANARGRGVATALIEAVAEAARARGAAKYYWLTKETNRPARALYDRIAKFNGFLRYDYPL